MSNEKDIVTERDKPFILALVASALLTFVIALAALGKLETSFFDKVFAAISMLVSTAFGYYYAKKNGS